MAAREPVKEALDRLLDPLDLTPAHAETTEDDDGAADAPARPVGVYTSRGSRDNVAAFFVRVRRSRRLLYKIPRVLVAWTALVLGVCALIWIIFAAAGLR